MQQSVERIAHAVMTAQIANGGYAIKPKIIVDNNPLTLEEAKKSMHNEQLHDSGKKLFKSKNNIKIVQEAIFSSTNERFGTSYRSRIDDPKYQFAGKTGTAQVKSCLLYTSPSPRDMRRSRMPSSA